MFALHGLALLLDPTLHFGFLAVLVPGAAPGAGSRSPPGSSPPG